MIVVADTGPINYLVLINCEHVLPALYSVVAIPPEVVCELQAPDAPEAVRTWANALPDWVQVISAEAGSPRDPQLLTLDAGEQSAIVLAAQINATLLLIDERAGSQVARNLGLQVTGTLGVLDEAARQGLISFNNAIDRLKATSFRYPRSLVERLLNQHGG